ncbi:MAG TPA: signal peptidase I [Firmicutes bacterium]|nr:signal peptidase I [Bacillota bacterium]
MSTFDNISSSRSGDKALLIFNCYTWLIYRCQGFKIKSMGRVINYLIFLFFFIFIGYVFGIKELKVYKVISSSMSPTLIINDRVMAIKSSNFKRKDIVAIKDPTGRNEILIKRIIGLPGENITVKNGYVYINGERLEEPYIKEKPIYTLSIKIPPDCYFLLGDNRNNSEDSSTWGPVKKEMIVGKVICCYWPIKRFKIFISKK